MNTKIKRLLPLLILALAGSAARASVYVDLHVSHLVLQDTPEVGDIGRKLSDDLPGLAMSFAIGTTLTPRINAELRYTHLGDLSVNKVSPNWTIFPPKGEVVLPAERYYRFSQTSQLFSFALPVKLLDHDRLSLSLTPLLHLELAEIAIDDLYINAQTVPGLIPTYRSDRTEVHFGTEVGLGYRLRPNLKLSLLYSYSWLESFDAHLFGTGLELKF